MGLEAPVAGGSDVQIAESCCGEITCEGGSRKWH
jgi:hypothetical protein